MPYHLSCIGVDREVYVVGVGMLVGTNLPLARPQPVDNLLITCG